MKKIIITGNASRDPEMRVDQSGNQFATFSVGVSVGTKQVPKTDWVDVICNSKLADVARLYVKKGSKLLIEGFPSASAYVNKENQPVAMLKVYANNIEFLNKREDEPESHNETVYSLPQSQVSGVSDSAELQSDDLNNIPF
jgi:single-strand DNA-binding protein